MDTLFPKRHVPYPRTGNQHLLAAICLFLLQPLLTQNRGTPFYVYWHSNGLYQYAVKEVTFAEGDPGRSPKRSQAAPFVAEEICQGRQATSLSMLLV